jgi:hypothetical protein
VATPAKLPLTSRPPVTTPRHNNSHVFACHTKLSHRLRCVVVFHHRCPPVSALVGAAQAAPLAKLLLPNACRGGHCLALPPRTCSRVDRCASTPHRATWLVSAPMLRPLHHLQQLKDNARRAFPPHEVIAAAAHCAIGTHECALLTGHGRALAVKAELSHPSHPPSAHAAIKGTFPVYFVCATGFLSIGKSPLHFPCSLSAVADVDSPPHYLSLPLYRSWGPFITYCSFSSPRSSTFDVGAPPHHRCAGEICFDAAPFLGPLPSLPTLSCQCVVT